MLTFLFLRKSKGERGVLISLTVHAGAGDVASLTATRERRGRVTSEYSKFRQPLRSLVVRSQRPLSSNNIFKILCALCVLCVRKQNICVVVIYLTQRAQRTRSFNFHTVHAGAGDVASFTTTGERKGRVTSEYSKQLLVSANLCALLSCGASDLSQAITFLKFFALFASSACGKKTSVWLYISRKERRERGVWMLPLNAHRSPLIVHR